MPTLGDLARMGARGMTTGTLGGPVDLINLLMLGAAGEKPVMGSEWIGDKLEGVGLLAPRGNDMGSTLAELAGGFASPGGLLKLAAGAKTLPLLAMALVGAKKGTKALPMDEASRMARAAEQGYDAGWLHGGDRTFDVIDPKLLGSATGANSARQAFFASDHPGVADKYAKMAAEQVGKKQGHVMPLAISPENPLTIEWPKGVQPYYTPEGEMSLMNLLMDAQDAGHDAVIINNAHPPGSQHAGARLLAVLPEHAGIVRDPSRAAFDQKKKGMSGLTLGAGGVGAGGLGGALVFGLDEDDRQY